MNGIERTPSGWQLGYYVWIVTDNADYDDLGAQVRRSQYQVFGGDRSINEYEAAMAMKICDDTGINFTKKAIWQDRIKIVKWLKDESLRKWLELKTNQWHSENTEMGYNRPLIINLLHI